MIENPYQSPTEDNGEWSERLVYDGFESTELRRIVANPEALAAVHGGRAGQSHGRLDFQSFHH